MFMLNDKPLPLDTPFTVGEGDEAIQYPANWLRLSTAEEKAAIGVTEASDPVPYDDRFYWGPNNPKQLDDLYEEQIVEGDPTQVLVSRGLKYNTIQQIKETAGKLLAPTDWMVLRQLFKGIGMASHYENYRDAVVAASNTFETQVNACTSVDELAALQFTWPNQKDF